MGIENFSLSLENSGRMEQDFLCALKGFELQKYFVKKVNASIFNCNKTMLE